MLRPRIIPVLLVHNGGLVKTVKFSSPRYVGDPINAVRIFNEKRVDELMILDIDATRKERAVNFEYISKLADECRMPLCYGGGVTTVQDARRLIGLGVEKVAMSSSLVADPTLASRVSDAVGQQSVVAVIDVKGDASAKAGYTVVTHNATRISSVSLFEFLEELQRCGVGEIVINSVDRDGCYSGFDLDLALEVRRRTEVPITFTGGCASLSDFAKLFQACGVVGGAAGSLFVYKGPLRAVLINYPSDKEREVLSHGELHATRASM